MKKSTKVILLIATLYPLLYMFIFMGFFFFQFASIQQGHPDNVTPDLFFAVFVLHFLTMIVMLGLTVIYIINVFRNEKVTQDKKALWAVVIFLGNMIAMPIYWYLYIWKEANPPKDNNNLC